MNLHVIVPSFSFLLLVLKYIMKVRIKVNLPNFLAVFVDNEDIDLFLSGPRLLRVGWMASECVLPR